MQPNRKSYSSRDVNQAVSFSQRMFNATNNKTIKKRVRLTREQKLLICQYYQANPNSRYDDLAKYVTEELGQNPPGESTMYKILSQHEELAVTPLESLKKASSKDAKYPELEAKLMEFILDMQRNHVPINYLSIITRAEILTLQHPELLNGLPKPQYSNGWIQRFTARMGVKLRSMNGEAGSVEIENYVIQDQLQRIREVMKDYDLKDIYNMDETGLMYRNAPTRTVSKEKVSGIKMDKSRMTVAFFCNADGSHKLEPIIIGTHAKPRCFKGRTGIISTMLIFPLVHSSTKHRR